MSSVFSEKIRLATGRYTRTTAEFYRRPENKDLVLFYEYFHVNHSRGVGASHQTRWTALVAELINDDAPQWE